MEQRSEKAQGNKSGKRIPLVLRLVIAVLYAALMVAVVLWLVPGVNPFVQKEAVQPTTPKPLHLFEKLADYLESAEKDTINHLEYIQKKYTLDRNATVAPVPDQNSFGTVKIADAAQILNVIDKAREYGLLEGQDVIFDPNAELYHDSNIQYYCDETILVICWKEMINRRVCSCVEVKIADGSQIRRKLVDDTYGTKASDFATNLAKSCNAVVAMNADFYSTRNYGITVYQGQLCRYQKNADSLLIDGAGDFHLIDRNNMPTKEEIKQYIQAHDIQFGLAFGPILVQNGELNLLQDNYGGIGEMHLEYSRAGIAQYDKLHYLYMTISHSKDGTPRAKINEFAEIIYSKGVQSAYNFDGGQTGEVVFQGVPYNHIDFGRERTVSDIIYFATAIPEEDR